GVQGVGPGFPIFDEALNAFKAANSARFIALSREDGRFSIKDVPPGQYTIRGQREGFFDPSNLPKVTVAGNQTVNAAISMLPGAVVSGRVRDASGQVLHNVDVQLLAMTYQNGYPVLRTVLTKPTDDQGAYRLFWLSPGQYYILV